MQDKTILSESLLVSAEEYGKTSLELFKLKVVSKFAELVSSFISYTTIILMYAMFISIASVGVALWIGDLLGKSYYGFFCVAGLYVLLGGVLHLFINRSVKKRIANSIILQLFN